MQLLDLGYQLGCNKVRLSCSSSFSPPIEMLTILAWTKFVIRIEKGLIVKKLFWEKIFMNILDGLALGL